jgi:hypothetical protein
MWPHAYLIGRSGRLWASLANDLLALIGRVAPIRGCEFIGQIGPGPALNRLGQLILCTGSLDDDMCHRRWSDWPTIDSRPRFVALGQSGQ